MALPLQELDLFRAERERRQLVEACILGIAQVKHIPSALNVVSQLFPTRTLGRRCGGDLIPTCKARFHMPTDDILEMNACRICPGVKEVGHA